MKSMSVSSNKKFPYQLTKWLDSKEELTSVIDQLGSKRYTIEQQGEKFAVFTDGKFCE